LIDLFILHSADGTTYRAAGISCLYAAKAFITFS